MPEGGLRYWDGEVWSDVPPPPETGPAPALIKVPGPVVPLLSPEEEVERAKSSAWMWAWLGVLFAPLALVAIWKNVDARQLGEKAGIDVGWGPTVMACILLAFAALWFLIVRSGALAGV